MKIFLFVLLMTAGLTGHEPTTVYLCDSPGANRYHLQENCRGLSNCQHRIIKVSLEDAKKSGKTLCGWEK